MAEKLTKAQKLGLLKDFFNDITEKDLRATQVIRGQEYTLGVVSFPIRNEATEGYGIIGLNRSTGSVVSFFYDGGITKQSFRYVTSLTPSFEVSVSAEDEQLEYTHHPIKGKNARSWNIDRILSGKVFVQLQQYLKLYVESFC